MKAYTPLINVGESEIGFHDHQTNYHAATTQTQPRFAKHGVNTLQRRGKFSWTDILLVILELVAATIASLTVFYSPIAAWLGVVQQLIVVGFLLAVMSICMEWLVMKTTTVYLGLLSSTTVQDIDATLRKDLFAPRAHILLRLIMLALMVLPLGLSAAYKTFTGGWTHVDLDPSDGLFGLSSTPGRQRIGNGLSLLSEVYVPFWIDPAINRTYGYNLYVPDNTTALVVDTPFPEYLISLRDTITDDQTITLSTTVNATVSELQNPTPEQRNSTDYWDQVFQDYPSDTVSVDNDVAGSVRALLWGKSGFNHSEAYFAWYNSTQNESFSSTAQRVVLSRRLASAKWLITRTNITLTSASLISNTAAANQSLVQANFLGLQSMYFQFLGEYDPFGRTGAFDQPYPGPPGAPYRYYQPANTVPALAASIMWSRITSLDTIDRPVGIQSTLLRSLSGYHKSAQDISVIKSVPTLQRKVLLLMVLTVYPVISIICVSLTALCYNSPISDNFNVTALLSAARDSDLRLLEGASSTGNLDRKIRLRFEARDRVQSGVEKADDMRVVLFSDGKR